MLLFGSEIECETLRDVDPGEMAQTVSSMLEAVRASFGGQAVELLETDRVTRKSALLKLRVAGSRVYAKRHRRRRGYLAERASLTFLAASGLVPRLIAFDDDDCLLVLECVPGVAGMDERSVWHAWCLGRIHGLWEVREAGSGGGLEPAPDRRWCIPSLAEAEKRIVDAFVAALPDGWQPLSIGDPKIEHVVGDGPGMRLVDFEHARVGRFDLYDLVMLVAGRSGRISVDRLLAEYDEGRGGTGSVAPRASRFADDLMRLSVDTERWISRCASQIS